MRLIKRALRAAVAALPLVALATPALAEDTLSAGDTAWMITATALVLMMTLPGLALFYGGLVRSKNVLSVLMQCMVTAGMASIVWVLVGYSLAFSRVCLPFLQRRITSPELITPTSSSRSRRAPSRRARA